LTTSTNKDEITLSELVSLVWQEKWLVILVTLAAFGASVAYAKLATEWWRADVLLAPAEQKNGGLAGSLGALGGLAGIAGIDLDGDHTAEPIATLQSGEFIGAFIEDQKLLPVLFVKRWDPVAKRWRGDPAKAPDLRDGIRLFQRQILSVNEDPKTRLVAVTVEWTHAATAAKWANMLVERLNTRMRDRALRDAERNIGYLRQELGKADIVTLKDSVARLLENEMQKLMLARGNDEYSFRVVDRAATPKWRARPKRVPVVILGTAAGGLLAVFLAVMRGRGRARITESK
jgi:uncharacterized protein involved in exopolysaccharide biosynthesis